MSNKYFNNATLNDFWNRLVTAVANLDQKALEPGAYIADGTFSNRVYTWDEMVANFENGTEPSYGVDEDYGISLWASGYDVIVPDAVTDVSWIYCKNIVLPTTTTHVGYTDNLEFEKIYIKATIPPELESGVFDEMLHNSSPEQLAKFAIVVPYRCGEAYKNATNWSIYADYITEGEMPGGSSADTWGPVTFDDSNMQGYVYLNTTYNVLETVDVVAYTIYNSGGNAVKHGCGFYDPSILDSGVTPLTDLPNGNYIVRIIDSGTSGMSSLVGLEGTLTIGTVEGTAKWVHNILMKHAKLTRDTAPVTPADYMKGIAVCARYMNNVSSYIDGSNTLSEIVRFVENIKPTDNSISFTVNQQPIAAQNDVQLVIIGTAGTISKVKISVYDETADVRLVATSDMDVSTASVNIMLSTIYRHFILDNYYRVQVIAYGPNNTSGTKELYITWPYDSGEGEPDACDHSWMRGNASDNYDGTHTQEFFCDGCGETRTEVESHCYIEGTCEYCGAHDDDYDGGYDGPGGGEE